MMALVISATASVVGPFNAAVATRVENRIALGDPAGADVSTARSNLQGPLPALDASPAPVPLPREHGGRHGPGQAFVRGRAHDADRPRHGPRQAFEHRDDRPRHGPRQAFAPHAERPRHGPRQAFAPHDFAPHGFAPHAGAPVRGVPPRRGSADTDAAIREAARVAGVDPNTMRAIASIESGMNPGSNRNRRTQYKGLYQIGREEWRNTGAGGDVYNARDNAMAAARLFAHHKAEFRRRYGRNPTDAELYMIHQQGLGFYTRGALTNVRGNPYPGMRGPQTHASFEAGWARELERRRHAFQAQHGADAAPAAKPAGYDPTQASN